MSGARGFSLLEVLVAVAIFAVLAVVSYGALDATLRTRADHTAAAAQLAALQAAVLTLERDLREASPRPIRGSAGERLPALLGNPSGIELTHAGLAGLADQANARLQRSTWQLDGAALSRLRWPVLDRAPTTQPVAQVMLPEVARLRLRYLDARGVWRDTWPPRNGPESAPSSLPRAVEFTVSGRAFGDIVRRVALVAPSQAQDRP